MWENSAPTLRPLPDHVTVFQWGFGEPVGEFRTNVAAVAGSCHVIVCCFSFNVGELTLRPLLDHLQFLSPDHLHELELGRHRLDRQRAQVPSSSTTSTAAQPSSKHKTTGFASALVMFQSHFGATPNPPWRNSSSIAPQGPCCQVSPALSDHYATTP